MKKILFVSILYLFILSSCSNRDVIIENLLKGEDRTCAEILEYGLVDNSSFSIRFSEKVIIKEVSYNGRKKKVQIIGDSVTLTLPFTLDMGEKYTLALTYSKNGGNTTRSFFTLYGKNPDKAGLIINEVSTDGSRTNPDRIELLVTKRGNTGGMMITDDEKTTGVVLPDMYVNKNDIIVIYWDTKSGKNTVIRDYEKNLYTYYIDGGMKSTLISTTGALLLYDEVGGKVIDALLYSDFTEASMKKEDFLSLLAFLEEEGEWDGDPVSSIHVTSSRVLARLPGGIDTDSADDWFTTAARCSSFGEPNTYSPYSEE